MKLIIRDKCPFCRHDIFKTLYKENYNSKILTDFLANYYSENILSKLLINEEYEIIEQGRRFSKN